MKTPLVAGLFLLSAGATMTCAQPPAGVKPGEDWYKELLEQRGKEYRDKELQVTEERRDHPIRIENLVEAGLQGLEHDLNQATALHDPEGMSTGLKLLEQFWSRAVALHDLDAITRIEADDFVCTDPSGAVTHKSDDLEAAKSDALQLADFKLEDIKVNLYGDAAVLTGINTFSGTAKDQPFSGSYRYTDVFVQRGIHWQVVASQATSIAPLTGKASPEPSPVHP